MVGLGQPQLHAIFEVASPVIISSFVWIGYQRVTDRQTDGRTNEIAVGITALCIASNAAAM